MATPILVRILIGVHLLAVCAHCREDQKSMLLQFKNSLGLNQIAGWDETADCCFWSGVICDSAGLVALLDFSNLSISSPAPIWSSLFDLHSLESLNLSYNKFNSSFPSGFDRLSSLKSLNLSNAGFTGNIPVEISRMTGLVSLDLSSNIYWNGIPSLQLPNSDLSMLVANLSHLTVLRLDGINVSGNGNEWSRILSSSVPKLTVLSLSSCYLSGPIDSSFFNLRSLSVIRLDNNNLSAPVPHLFAGFSNLTSLRLASSGLFGDFPQRIFQVPTLQHIDLSNNKALEGSLPSFPPNASLHTLKLSVTGFSGTLPDSISSLSSLSTIDLSGCRFSGSIPQSMENLTQLVYLDFSSNGFNGSVPSFIKSENLTNIVLNDNGLSGPVPLQWEGLQKLVYLALDNNSMSGSVPGFLFSLPSLQKMKLSNNRFSGVLRVSNVSSRQLDTVDLSSNKLGGPLPISVFDLKGLKYLSLSYNNFSGSLQLNVIQQLVNLSYIDLSYNSLSVDATDSKLQSPQMTTLKLASCKLTSFPGFLKNQSALTHLDLSMNEIKGSIPNWIWGLGLSTLNLSFNSLTSLSAPVPSNVSLGVLDLHSNQLQGPIPILPISATFLDYSSNNLSSPIPYDIGTYLPFAIFFSLSSNDIHGSIPPSVCNATYLQVLDLSNNSLTGMIPDCLMAMSSTLGVINLRRNNLDGSIGDSFPKNCTLKTLDLSGNQLQGKIPKSLANCQSLEVLNFGSNRMYDVFPCHLKNRTTSLRVLVLRSNQFYGLIGCVGLNKTWQMLQIVDLAYNNFNGSLPRNSLTTWRAMMFDKDINHIQYEFLGLTNLYYQDAVTVTNKGLEVELVKILTVFTSIDLSCNQLEGPIPKELGDFKALYLLNLSHNALTGRMPSVLGNLSHLESLDLSVNHLSGTIPVELADLNFLSFLNLSDNQLVGRIPTGSQLQTFSESCFQGNEGLCGPPLITKCQDPPVRGMESDQDHGTEFDWQFIYTGMGFGVGSAVVVAPLMMWQRGMTWSDHLVDQILLAILPMVGLRYTIWRDEGDESETEEESCESQMYNDGYGDESEQLYCVFCTQIDISWKRVVHNPKCACHPSLPISFFSS